MRHVPHLFEVVFGRRVTMTKRVGEGGPQEEIMYTQADYDRLHGGSLPMHFLEQHNVQILTKSKTFHDPLVERLGQMRKVEMQVLIIGRRITFV